jgi:hypothetical protein
VLVLDAGREFSAFRSKGVWDNKLLAALPHEWIAHDLPLTLAGKGASGRCPQAGPPNFRERDEPAIPYISQKMRLLSDTVGRPLKWF